MLPISFGSCNFYPSHNELLHAQLMTIRPENIPADGVIRGMVDLNGKALVVEMSGMCLSDVGTPPSPVGYGPGRPHPITGCVVGYAKFLDHVFSLETRHLSLLDQEDRALPTRTSARLRQIFVKGWRIPPRDAYLKGHKQIAACHCDDYARGRAPFEEGGGQNG